MASATPWLDIAKGELGTKEAPGAKDNPRVVAYYADAGHPEIHDDSETAWCAAFVGACLKRAGYPNSGSLAARSYLTYGQKLDKPVPGCIVVFWRGSPTSWQGHVAFYERDDGTHIRVLGGNQGDAVTEASFPKSQVLAYRWPVAPTVSALRAAGSREIKAADITQTVGAVGAAGTVAAVAQAPVAPPPIIPTPDPSLINAIDTLTLAQKLMEAVRAIAGLVSDNLPALVVGLCLAAIALGWWIKRRRVAKHRSGQPIGVGAA